MARRIKFTPTLAAAAAALILAAGAGAQPERRPGPPGPPPPPRGGELRGPSVRDDRAPGTDEGFVRGGNQGRMGMGERIPPRVFLDALHSLGDDKLPEGVRATPQQMDRLTAMSEAFRAQRDAYMKQNADELRQLRQDAGMGRAEGGRPGPGGPGGPRDRRPEGGPEGRGDRRTGAAAPPPPPGSSDDGMNSGAPAIDPAKREQARARIREIEANAPKIEDVYTKAWAELNDAQKKHVEAKLAEFRERGAKEREDNYVRQRVAQRGGGRAAAAPGGPDAPPPPPGAGERRARPDVPGPGPEPGAMDDRALRDRRQRMMRIFEQLPPEEQDRILSRLEQRFADRLQGGRAAEGDRPAPPPRLGEDAPRPRRRRGDGDAPPPRPQGD